MIYNNASLAFEVTSRTKTNIKTAIQFSTQDVYTARLIFSLTKDGVPLPLSAVTGKLVMLMADGSRFIRSVEITDKVEGVAQYVLSAEEIRHSGDVQAELYLYYANKQALSIHKFSFTIDKALIDTDIVPLAEYYVDDFEELRQQINDLYDEVVETVEELRKKFEDLENIETKEGAQEKADAAEKNAKAYTDTHTKRTDNPHSVTKSQIGLGNVENVKQETPDGAQAKADKALADSIAYTDEHTDRTDNPHSVTKGQIGLNNVDNVKQAPLDQFRAHDTNGIRHISQAERDKWNDSQIAKLTKDDGKRTQLANETDILALSSGFYYANGTSVKNNPVANDSSWFNYDVIEGDSGRKSIIAWRSHDNTLWHATVHTDGVFKGWKRIITSTDFESNEWREPTLKNGWTNYTDSSNGDQTQYKVRYSKDTAGTVSVEGAMAKGTVGSGVVAFVLPEGYRPGRAFQWLGVSSQIGMNGIPQYHRLLVEVNGQVIIESCSNTQRPNEYISLGFQFKAG
ncbi:MULTISPECIES: BppU family phage baseplate upper protein [Bacillus]|uniref:BppU family phage baseplate upper protein n=1 Tax=Bacillus TaxID=1386 RepID=UPI001CD462F6|nr:phage baseplate upper protein [Bacillus amyloliquefaciens]